jgi:hypothetical protein
MNASALSIIQHIVSYEVLRAEINLIGSSNQDKHSIVEKAVIEWLNRIYDQADSKFNLCGLVDLIAKETVIPVVGSIISSAVDKYKIFGWDIQYE